MEIERTKGKSLIHNPLEEIAFKDAINISDLANSLSASILDNLNNELLEKAPDIGAIGFKSLEFVNDQNRLYFELSSKNKRLVSSGKAYFETHKKTGRILPFIRDAKTGKTIEFVKGTTKKLATKISQLSTIVVSAAHIISGADLSKRLSGLCRAC